MWKIKIAYTSRASGCYFRLFSTRIITGTLQCILQSRCTNYFPQLCQVTIYQIRTCLLACSSQCSVRLGSGCLRNGIHSRNVLLHWIHMLAPLGRYRHNSCTNKRMGPIRRDSTRKSFLSPVSMECTIQHKCFWQGFWGWDEQRWMQILEMAKVMNL